MTPKKYVERVKAQYLVLFGENPCTRVTSPLEKNDHPELDTSPLLNDEGISKYQSLIGALQWAITLGRFDIAVGVMSLSSFRVAPRVGHLERLKRIVQIHTMGAPQLCRLSAGCASLEDSHMVCMTAKDACPGSSRDCYGRSH